MNTEEIVEYKLEKIANTSELDVAIKRLERRVKIQEVDLQDHAHVILESLKPANILRTTIHEVQQSTDLKNNLFKVALGLGAGYFSRKLVVGKSAGLVKKALGTALQFGITHFIAKKPELVDSYAYPRKKNLLKRIFSV